MKDWLKCRTVGLCMAYNRLLNFHIVRSTRPVQWTPAMFVPSDDSRALRDPSHVHKCPEYPDPKYYLNHAQKYFFRHAELRHLRVEQFNRYFAMAGDKDASPTTLEDTIDDEDDALPTDATHRHYDPFMEHVTPGTTFKSAFKNVPGCRRRKTTCLGVSRIPFLEPIGASRELFYEAKLVLGLAWFCEEKPEVADDGAVVWAFKWLPPSEDEIGARLDPIVLSSRSDDSFEERCAAIEAVFCDHELGVVCGCCAGEMADSRCKACSYAVGWHRCQNRNNMHTLVWRKGTLHDGHLDAQRVLFNLHRKLIPLDALKEKADLYVGAGLVTQDQADRIIRVIEQERNFTRVVNDVTPPVDPAQPAASSTGKLSAAQLRALLTERESMMQAGGTDAKPTDQWRVYKHIVGSIAQGRYLRLMVQASAGTGKSFLLSSVFLWCIVNGIKTNAAAPTGIAAANIEVKRTEVCATTIHNMLEMDGEYKSALDYSKLNNSKVSALMQMDVLLLDEVSMTDSDCFSSSQAPVTTTTSFTPIASFCFCF